MADDIRIVTVDAGNVAQEGFFCYKSKPKAPGYQRKLSWLQGCFAEGLKLKILYEGKRSIAFVEYMPGETTWRAVEAPGYVMIHCLWVVGSGKGKGYFRRLLDLCEAEAREQGAAGMAMVTSGGNWLSDKSALLHRGYAAVDSAPPAFDLVVKRFGEAPLPAFPGNWGERLARFGPGLTVYRVDQCPYLEDATRIVQEAGAELDIPVRVIEPQSAAEARANSPSPYGVFAVVYDGKLLGYHYLEKKDLVKLLVPAG